jgi:hypothetical protein
MRVCAASVAACVLTFGIAAESFKVRLRPVPIEAATAAATKGEGDAAAELDGRRLRLTGRFAGLQGPATIARLHEGPVMGVRGPAIAEVAVPAAQSGTFNAELTLTAAQAAGLRDGRVYLQIHSQSAPEGNLWGWLLQ